MPPDINHPLADHFPPQQPKICQRCLKFFTCGAGNCWCTKLWLPSTLLAALRESYTDCLCQPCLEELKNESHLASNEPGKAVHDKSLPASGPTC